ncbi:hypothetical protein RMSM_05093 [Rhodopirellula maiorica SM1]|uniref:Uncharacterized protein n=1 Tax=Rhodopirellula maiorica SM1 TaxID=1265738 RepID=M5RFU7_9BACT|nr:hypothetical protein RMSM_05093 [Rhodopirellula maiorica SM1]
MIPDNSEICGSGELRNPWFRDDNNSPTIWRFDHATHNSDSVWRYLLFRQSAGRCRFT